MTTAVLRRDTLMPRPPGGMGRGLVLALLVHVLLVIALAFSVRWRASEPEGVEAELWASVPQIAAPPAPAPTPAPAPPVAAPPPPPPAAAKAEPEPDPQIAIEQARREAAEKERHRVEEQRKLAEQRRAAEAEDKRRKDEAARVAEDKRRKAEDERRHAEQLERQRVAELEKSRQKTLERMMAQAGGSGSPDSTGSAERSAGPSAGYAGRIKARIKPNIVFTDLPAGNPVAEVELRLAPDGTIVGQKLARPSGLKEWDDAVMRAIDRTQVLPRDVDGRVPSTMVIAFRPRD